MALRILGAALSRLSLTTTTTTSTTTRSMQQRQLWWWSSFSRLQSRLSPPSASVASQASHCTAHSGRVGSSLPTLCSLVVQQQQSPRLPPQVRGLATSCVRPATLNQMHRTGPIKKERSNKNPLGKRPYARGVVLKTLIKKPKKPNSANRKCVLVRLATGKELVAFVPGEGHNLQEHNIVLVQPGRLRDVPGVKVRCVRGKYDLQHVIKKQN